MYNSTNGSLFLVMVINLQNARRFGRGVEGIGKNQDFSVV
jgi:hypothetical protein